MRTHNTEFTSPSGADNSSLFQSLRPGNLIFEKLFAAHGPLMQVDKAWPLLGFNSRDAFNKAILRKHIPLRVLHPDGRRKSFIATLELANYLACLMQSEKGDSSP